MIILLIVIVLFILGCVLVGRDDELLIIPVLLFLVLVVFLISMLVSRNSDRAFVEKYKATKMTLELFREKNDDFEKTSVINEVIKINQGIKELQYSNKSIWWWDFWTDDIVDDLGLIY